MATSAIHGLAAYLPSAVTKALTPEPPFCAGELEERVHAREISHKSSMPFKLEKINHRKNNHELNQLTHLSCSSREGVMIKLFLICCSSSLSADPRFQNWITES